MSDQFLQSELATLLEYSNLLKKNRPASAEESMKHIIAEEKNLIARINRIKELDSILETEPEGGVSSVTEQIQKQTKEEEKQFVIKKVSFFTYFFSIRKVLVSLCKDSSILISKLFGFRFQISDETFSLLEEIRSNILNHILAILQKILENGWKLLEPYHYNHFYILHHFLNNFIKNFILDQKNISRNITFIDSFAKEFLTLLENKKRLQAMREGVYIYYGNKENEEMVQFLLFLEGIFDKRKKFSLLNYVLVTYSVHYRHPISLEEMLEAKGVADIPETKYLAIQKVKYLMMDYLEKLKAKQSMNEKKLFYLKHIEEDKPDLIEDFIKENASERFKLEFFAADLLKSAEDFVSAFLKYSKLILIGEVVVEKDNQKIKATIFKDVWDAQISRLNSLLKEISYQKETYKYLFITLETYEKFIEQNKHLESEKDEKFCVLVDKVVLEMYQFFETIVQILYNDYHLTYNESKDVVLEKLKTRDKAIVETESIRFLPYATYKTQKYDETVFNILTRLAVISGTFLNIIGYVKTLERLKEKNSLIESSKRNLEQIMKISS